MHFFKLHIGDWDQATRHLSFLEEAVYSRLIRKYYAEERPLPADVDECCRLIGARHKGEREAVARILKEFFFQNQDFLHHKRCDAEIARANKQAEANRQTAIAREQRRRAEREAAAKGTDREQTVTAEDAAPENDSSDSREPTHYPLPKTKDKTLRPSKVVGTPGARDLSDDRVPTTAIEWAKFFETEFGVVTDTYSATARAKFWPLAQAWIDVGVSLGRMREAVARAKDDAGEPIMYLPGYVSSVLAHDQARKVRPARSMPLHAMTDQQLNAEGRRFGLEARPGEERPAFIARIQTAQAGAQGRPAA